MNTPIYIMVVMHNCIYLEKHKIWGVSEVIKDLRIKARASEYVLFSFDSRHQGGGSIQDWRHWSKHA